MPFHPFRLLWPAAIIAFSACAEKPPPPPQASVQTPEPVQPTHVRVHRTKAKRATARSNDPGLSERERQRMFGEFQDWQTRKEAP